MKGIISEGSDPKYQIKDLDVMTEQEQIQLIKNYIKNMPHLPYIFIMIGDEVIIFSDKYCLMAQKSIKYCYRRLNTRSNINLDC